MRDFSFVKTDQPTMFEFNKRFGSIADAFNNIGNEYMWAKTTSTVDAVLDGETEAVNRGFANGSNYDYTYYADNAKDLLEGNGTKIESMGSNTSTITAHMNEVLRGKYVQNLFYSAALLYIPEDAVISYTTNNYMANKCLVYSTSRLETTVHHCGYVNSPNPNAYPVNDGYTYTALGQLGAKVQIATGSYTGTDTYGANNPNSLTFDFAPKLLIISAVYNNNTAGCIAVIVPGLCGSYSSQGLGDKASSYVNILGSGKSGNTVTWWSNWNSGTQLNSSTVTYEYRAIG